MISSKVKVDEEEPDEPTEEELEILSQEIFDELKSAKSGKVTLKKFRN